MKQLHMTASPKGGTGKSFIASILTQWLLARGAETLIPFDNDASNATFISYAALGVRKLELRSGNKIDRLGSSPMFETILREPGPFVVDNGGSNNFFDLMAFVGETDLINSLAEEGIQTTLHVPVKGGGDIDSSIEGFRVVATDPLLAKARLVVWLNEHEGPIIGNGVEWENMKVFKANRDRVHSIVTIPRQEPGTVGTVLTQMLKQKMTFGEVKGSDFDFTHKLMLRTFFGDLCSQLDQVVGADLAQAA